MRLFRETLYGLNHFGAEDDFLTKEQMIIEEGQVVPADGNLICDYAAPEGFAEWQKLRDEDPDKTHEHEKGEESDDDGEAKHHGNSVAACDQVSLALVTYFVF